MQWTSKYSKMKLLLICLFILMKKSEAAIDAWAVPVISGANGAAAVIKTISESVTAGDITGINITATPNPTGTVVSYSLLSQQVQGMFTIDQSTGAVTFAKGGLDFETTPTYLIVVRASDGTGTDGTANVTLNVGNSPPVFTSTTYNKEMCDGAKAGANVATVKATDPGNTAVSYAFSGTGNTNSDFAMAGATGVITVAASKTLNMTRTKAYVLDVTASDTVPSTPGVGMATVSVSVKVCSGGTSAIAIAYCALLLSIIVNRL